MITIAMSRVIHSRRARVWHALVTPSELIRWDERRVALEEPAPGYPTPGHPAHWRTTLGSLQVPLSEDPLELIPAERLRLAVRLGTFPCEETYQLVDDDADDTRVSLRLVAESTVPVIGGELDRFDVRRLAAERVDETLEWLAAWCEKHPEIERSHQM